MVMQHGEPGRTASALLAVFVHLCFFAFLYFGVSWQPKPQEPLVADLWSELPPVRPVVRAAAPPPRKPEPVPEASPPPPAPAPPPPVPKAAPPPPKPVPPQPKPEPKAPTKADIELKEKQRKELAEKKAAEEARRKEALQKKEEERKRKEEERREAEERKREEQAKAEERKREEQAKAEELRREEEDKRKAEEARRQEEEKRLDQVRREQEERMDREGEARRTAILEEQQKLAAAARVRAEQEARAKAQAAAAAARAKELDAWKERIGQRIRSKVVVPPNVPDSAQAEYSITIIPGGEVLAVKLRKSSGYPAYDAAIERAIYAAAPLPVPSDPGLFRELRELNLVFRPN